MTDSVEDDLLPSGSRPYGSAAATLFLLAPFPLMSR